MTTLMYFLAASGVLFWCTVVWRGLHIVRHAVQRLRWALWGYRKPRRQRAA